MSGPFSGPVVGGPADRGVFAGPSSGRRPAASAWWAFLGGEGRAEALERYGALAARALVSQIFLISGVMKIVDWSGTEEQMAKQQMFAIPFFHVAAMLVELAAGLSLLLGYKARLGALLLFLYLIPVTFTFHHFWSYPPEKQQDQMFFFIHNWALMGGLLYLTVWGPGPLSLDLKGRRPS
jgi:putative oxidoreductase